MNKFLSMVACAAIICGMTSCGDSEVLSVSSAKKALKKEAFFAKDYATHNFNTGFYEVDETDLDRLLKNSRKAATNTTAAMSTTPLTSNTRSHPSNSPKPAPS